MEAVAGRVSVIIPSHSHVDRLPAALTSAAGQDYADLEIIVVDDGSPSDVRAVVAALPTTRPIRYLRQEKTGAWAARNTGRRHASGEFLAFLDEDDTWAPDKLSVTVALARRHPGAGAVFSDGTIVADDGTRGERFHRRKGFAPCPEGGEVVFPPSTLGLATLLKGIVVTSSALLRREVFDIVGGFANLRSGQDVDLFFRVQQRFALGYCARPLFDYALTAGSISRSGVATLHHSLALFDHLSQLSLSANDVRALRAERARVERQLGEFEFEAGNARAARGHLIRSLRGPDAIEPRSLMLLAAALLPAPLRAAVRGAWHRARGHRMTG